MLAPVMPHGSPLRGHEGDQVLRRGSPHYASSPNDCHVATSFDNLGDVAGPMHPEVAGHQSPLVGAATPLPVKQWGNRFRARPDGAGRPLATWGRTVAAPCLVFGAQVT